MSDIDCIIIKAKKVGISAIIGMGVNKESNNKILQLSKRYPGYIFTCLGIHPGEISKIDVKETITHIKENISKCIGIGEIGLDYSQKSSRSNEIRSEQRKIYIKLLSIAKQFSLPVVIHSRSAYKESFSLLKEYGPNKAVFHWYDGPTHILKEILEGGFFVSATPAATYSKGLKNVLSNTPLEQILVETDSPVYIRKYKRISEPADLTISLKSLAEIKALSIHEVNKITSLNTQKLFNINLDRAETFER
jgi:TatD DNase family protein